MGNIEPDDGWRFIGRGPYQTTGRGNYMALSKATGDSLDVLTGDASPLVHRATASRSAALFWMLISGNTLADASDSRELRRRGNGGYVGLPEVLDFERQIRMALE